MHEDENQIELTEPSIETWLLDNPLRAHTFGARLIAFMADEDGLKAQESLGVMEDRLTIWAIDNKLKSRFLLLRLMGKILKAKEDLESHVEKDDSDS